jgi:uncharacterized membrane protein YfcA
MPELSVSQWLLAVLGSLLVGLSKTGLPGLGVFAVAIFANILPAKQSTGALLLLLVCADIVAVAAYRSHARWRHLGKLFPWVAAGVALGCLVMGPISDAQVARLIGAIVLAMVAMHLWRERKLARDPDRAVEQVPHAMWFVVLTGILTGFTTMLANAAGPVMVVYLLAMRLPKLEFLGTMAWFFLIINVFKIPFSHGLGLISAESLVFNAKLAPAVVASALFGRYLIGLINQKLFAALALLFACIAGLRLLLA